MSQKKVDMLNNAKFQFFTTLTETLNHFWFAKKAATGGVLLKRCSSKFPRIYRKIPVLDCKFIKKRP